jgi:hypothetical protein
MIDRSAQYTMGDDSSAGKYGWRGWSKKNPHLWMTGEVIANSNGGASYVETLHDDHRGDTVVMRSTTECYQKDAPVVASNGAPPAPTYASPATNRMPIKFARSGLMSQSPSARRPPPCWSTLAQLE